MSKKEQMKIIREVNIDKFEEMRNRARKELRCANYNS